MSEDFRCHLGGEIFKSFPISFSHARTRFWTYACTHPHTFFLTFLWRRHSLCLYSITHKVSLALNFKRKNYNLSSHYQAVLKCALSLLQTRFLSLHTLTHTSHTLSKSKNVHAIISLQLALFHTSTMHLFAEPTLVWVEEFFHFVVVKYASHDRKLWGGRFSSTKTK